MARGPHCGSLRRTGCNASRLGAAGLRKSDQSESRWTMAKFASVDDHLESLPAEKRAVLEEIEQRVLAVVPGAERVIRYEIPTWQVDGTSLVHAAAWNERVNSSWLHRDGLSWTLLGSWRSGRRSSSRCWPGTGGARGDRG
jgi:hypothetical protein